MFGKLRACHGIGRVTYSAVPVRTSAAAGDIHIDRVGDLDGTGGCAYAVITEVMGDAETMFDGYELCKELW